MRPILKSPRILRTGQPLELTAIRQVCPAVFAEGPHELRGPKYRYVPTIKPLETLLENGWGVYEASQQQALKVPSRNGFTKHMLRLRKIEDFNSKQNVGDGVAEVILINAHDGTSAYHLKAGYFRLVCSNGMMTGTAISGFKVYHSVNRQTSQEVLEAGERMVTESFPAMMERIGVYKSITLDAERQYQLANKAISLRYPNVLSPFPASDLLAVRRPEDADPTLWNVLNRVQESIMYGGWDAKGPLSNRTTKVRPIERVSAVAAINSGLWDAAESISREIENE